MKADMLRRERIHRRSAIVMGTHDSQVVSRTKRMIMLKDGKTVQEKQGVHPAKRKLLEITNQKAKDDLETQEGT